MHAPSLEIHRYIAGGNISLINGTIITGWWFYPSRKILVNGKDYPILWKIKNVPNHQPDKSCFQHISTRMYIQWLLYPVPSKILFVCWIVCSSHFLRWFSGRNHPLTYHLHPFTNVVCLVMMESDRSEFPAHGPQLVKFNPCKVPVDWDDNIRQKHWINGDIKQERPSLCLLFISSVVLKCG